MRERLNAHDVRHPLGVPGDRLVDAAEVLDGHVVGARGERQHDRLRAGGELRDAHARVPRNRAEDLLPVPPRGFRKLQI